MSSAGSAGARALPSGTQLRRRRRVRVLGLLVLLALLCGATIFLYLDGRSSLHHRYVAGDREVDDRILLSVTVQQVSPADNDVTLRVLPTPQGALARPEDGTPTKAFEVRMGENADPSILRFPAREPVSVQTVTVNLGTSGTFSDYPFDRYTTDVAFLAVAGGNPLAMLVNLRDVDPFFVTRAPATLAAGHVVEFGLRFSRSRGTFILAWFIMVAMWGLALAVLGGAWVLITRRRGLVWPAFGWMAATLFALVSVRNAAPGSPPIGSLIDYAAFFWAEGIIAASTVAAAFFGFRAEMANRDGVP